MTLNNQICLIWMSALMVASGLCEAQEETPRAAHHKPIKSLRSHAATPYGANLSEAESLRALESESLANWARTFENRTTPRKHAAKVGAGWP